MNCTVCGAMIPDGQTTCPSCGNPVATNNSSQPVQPMGGFAQPVQPGQPMGGYQQPVQPGQPMGGYQQPVQPNQPMGGYQQPVQPMGGYQQGQPMGGYQQPVQPMGGYQQGQPMGGYQQPMNGYGQPMGGSSFNFNGFANSLKGQAGSMKLLALIGGLFITLAPFFNWYSAKVKYDGEKTTEHHNLFGLDTAFFTITALIMILCGVVLIAEALKDNIPAVQSILNKNQYMQYVGLGLVVLVLLFWFLAFFNGDLKAIIESEKESLDFIREWVGDDVKGHVNHGFGPILSMIGIVCSAFPRVMQLLKKTNY
ncbi:MAG: zinc-ribbon domain-containing protein [Clostridium sp.]|nr:zinc-ribbon domain-containing protein [Clostridium sp.]